YPFTQQQTTRVKSLGNQLHCHGAKKLLVGHRGNSKLLLHTNHAQPHGATKIERFTASEEPAAGGRLEGWAATRLPTHNFSNSDESHLSARHCELSEAIHLAKQKVEIAPLRSQCRGQRSHRDLL